MNKYLRTLPALALVAFAGCDCGTVATGIVTDRATGEPIVGATVDVYSPGKNDEVAKYRATTGTDGRFELKYDLCGDYMLTAQFDGYVAHTADAGRDVPFVLSKE